MGDEPAPSKRKNIYKVLRLHGFSDMELDEFIEAMLRELKILAEYRGLADVSTHLGVAIRSSEKARQGEASTLPDTPTLLGVRRKRKKTL